MATRSEREKRQSLNDHNKKVLAQLIGKEDNKFCADCHAKGPRWVSWNLGVFLCIRCSGIHRSLGVHISKVKSVNLDTWTTDQLVRVCQRGNQWAKDKYEHNLPRDYKRPQTDSSMEYFIRDKYERMKYATNTEVKLRPIEEFNVYLKTPSPNVKQNEKKRNIGNGVPIIRSMDSTSKSEQPAKPTQTTSTQQAQQQARPAPAVQQTPNIMDDLLGLDTPVKAPVATAPVQKNVQPSDDLTDIFSCMQSNAAPTSTTPIPSAVSETQVADDSRAANKQMSKDSILSLYSQNQPMNVQPNPYMNSGSYMPGQNQMTFQQNASFQSGYSQANNAQGNMNFPQQAGMQGFVQSYNWQQQQMQQQLQNMQLNQPGQGLTYGGMRSCNSMPQMSQPQGGAVWTNQMQPANNGMLSAPTQNHLRNSQPTLSGLDTLGSWGNSQPNSSGQTLSTQLWK